LICESVVFNCIATPEAKAPIILKLYAALKRRFSTVLDASVLLPFFPPVF
jgi:hypothetical protein